MAIPLVLWLLFLSAGASEALAQRLETKRLLERFCASDSGVHSADMILRVEQQPLFSLDTLRSTYYFRYVTEGDTLKTYFLAGDNIVRSYDSGIYRSKSASGLEVVRLSSADAYQKIVAVIKMPVLHFCNNLNLRELTEDTLTHLFEMSDGQIRFRIQRSIPYPIAFDSGITEEREEYLFGDNELMSAVVSMNAYGGEIWTRVSYDAKKNNKTIDADILSAIKAAYTGFPGLQSLPPRPPKPEPLVVGSLAPSWIGVSREGDTVHSGLKPGRYTLMDFWFSGCPGCFWAKPYIQKIREKFADSVLRVIGIDPVDNDFRLFLRASRNDGYPNVLVPKQVAGAYHLSAYPSFYLIDPSGRVKAFSNSPIEITSIIEQAISEK